MQSLLTRIKDTILADLNAVLDQKESDNPVTTLNQYLRQCEQETEKVGKLVERQLRLKDEFSSEYKEASELAEKRKYQADIAFQAGETDLGQIALAEHLKYSERTQRLSASLVQVTEQVNTLEKKYQEMKHKLKDMQLRRLELMGRENVTRANQGMDQVLESNYGKQSYSKFKEIENYLDRLEKKINDSNYHSMIDSRIAQLEKQFEQESK